LVGLLEGEACSLLLFNDVIW